MMRSARMRNLSSTRASHTPATILEAVPQFCEQELVREDDWDLAVRGTSYRRADSRLKSSSRDAGEVFTRRLHSTERLRQFPLY